jgi:starch phosphorylase
MSDHNNASSPAPRERALDADGYDLLAELALDLRSSWNHATDCLWRRLDPVLWTLTHNPWVVVQTVSRDKIRESMDDPGFRKIVDGLIEARRHAAHAPAWFQKTHPHTALTSVAYFSMEYMLSEALPVYSGGLGNVAGDQLKAAGDLGVPVIGVGLLFSKGYFRQIIDNDGAQQALYPFNDPGQLPITPLRQANGEWLRLEVALPGYSVWLRAWQVQVGRVKLYLLDSNDAANHPIHRGITSELYGGNQDLRLKQELILGIAGWRLLRALKIQPEVCHLNEGHAAFAILERARDFMEQNDQPFDVSLTATRAGNLFTTHTAVAAGFDRFPPALIEQYLTVYAQQKLHIPVGDLLALGRANPRDPSELFNMAYLAVRGCGAVNGVSRLHGMVSRQLFAPLFPRWTQSDVPIGSVTNGIHTPTWDSAAADALWTQACGKDRWLGTLDTLEKNIHSVSDAALWQLRTGARRSLVDYARERLSTQLAASGASAEAVNEARHLFDPQALTLGFARRFATYKRPNLLLHDRERLLRLLRDPRRPVQLIMAGKAHPADQAGQALIQEWILFMRQQDVRAHVIFLSDYDMLLTEHLVQGVDVWINTPQRPWEACGTSGMKVLVNGGINLSELDGWWAEAFTPDLGWAIGDGPDHGPDFAGNAIDANALYDLLERAVIPEFYDRRESGMPIAWIKRMRDSMAHLTPQFSANRAVREYTERHYLPAATEYRARAADRAALGRSIADWQRALDQKWDSLRFGSVRVNTGPNVHEIEVELFLNGMDPHAVEVQVYANPLNGEDSAEEMTRVRTVADPSSPNVYRATVCAGRPIGDYTARVLPAHAHASVPLECARIAWQR